jgi:hypothetical protein
MNAVTMAEAKAMAETEPTAFQITGAFKVNLGGRSIEEIFEGDDFDTSRKKLFEILNAEVPPAELLRNLIDGKINMQELLQITTIGLVAISKKVG